MELMDTVAMMNSPDYKERFKAEYFQLLIRYRKLADLMRDWSEGRLEFTPTCPMSTYKFQMEYMDRYMAILEIRAALEGIDLSFVEVEEAEGVSDE